MNSTEYKGFNIEERVTRPGDVSHFAETRFFVDGQGFNVDGYASLSNAKGAITKAVNARNAKHDESGERYDIRQSGKELAKEEAVVVVTPAEPVQASPIVTKCASKEDADKASVTPIGEPGSMTFGESNNVEMNSDNLMALLRYHGFTKPVHSDKPRKVDYRSRAKREGSYAGRIHGQEGRIHDTAMPQHRGGFYSMPETRKQRKAFKLEQRGTYRHNPAK